jgi:hypothetical protein
MSDPTSAQAALPPPESPSLPARGVSVEARALGLLRAIADEAESLNEHIAVHGRGSCNGVRTRVQNIHGLAVTPEVEEWPLLASTTQPEGETP